MTTTFDGRELSVVLDALGAAYYRLSEVRGTLLDERHERMAAEVEQRAHSAQRIATRLIAEYTAQAPPEAE